MTDIQLRRFWTKVRKTDGCWLWTAATQKGYGVIRINKVYCRAHRVSYTLEHGPIADKLFVLHRCDVRACVRPDHLFLGTQTDNMQDKSAKGRHHVQRSPSARAKFLATIRPEHRARGERNGLSKLTGKAVQQIRARREQGWSQQRIADEVGVCQTAISSVLRGATWKHIN